MIVKKVWTLGIASIALMLGSHHLAAWTVEGEDANTLSLLAEERQGAPALSNKIEGTGIFEKKVSSLTYEEQLRTDFQAAVKFMEKGAELQAEEKFLAILKKMPSHLKTRSELAHLYLKHNRDKEAEVVLSEGFKQSENYPDFLKLQAMIHERRQEPDRSLALLIKLPAGMQNDSKTVALFGHLYQQSGQYDLAKLQYKRLLEVEPSNVTWLLGYTIAMDSEGHKEAAIEGYKRLQSTNDLNPEVLQYIGDRLKTLQG